MIIELDGPLEQMFLEIKCRWNREGKYPLNDREIMACLLSEHTSLRECKAD
jgi:hypothetical protein